MYEEVERTEKDDVAIGCVKVIELIPYDFVRIETNDLGKKTVIESSRKPCYCQTKEQQRIFMENNPGVRQENSEKVIVAASGVRVETFNLQLLKETAIEYLNDPENRKQFTKRI